MDDPFAPIEAVLAAEQDSWATYKGAMRLVTATYPEALAVVREVVEDHTMHGPVPLERCDARRCRAAAAYLAKAQEYVPVQEAKDPSWVGRMGYLDD